MADPSKAFTSTLVDNNQSYFDYLNSLRENVFTQKIIALDKREELICVVIEQNDQFFECLFDTENHEVISKRPLASKHHYQYNNGELYSYQNDVNQVRIYKWN